MEIISKNKKILAIIIRKDFKNTGIKFFTPNSFSQQLAQMTHKKGKKIDCHYHQKTIRKTVNTQEVLIIKKGKLKVFLFEKKKLVCTKILKDGDVILLAFGGHGFKVLSDVTFIEVKQGPYSPKTDKIVFKSKYL
jgi:mannose-6-phosphate isomerase-like protein (cupin superfamily)